MPLAIGRLLTLHAYGLCWIRQELRAFQSLQTNLDGDHGIGCVLSVQVRLHFTYNVQRYATVW